MEAAYCIGSMVLLGLFVWACHAAACANAKPPSPRQTIRWQPLRKLTANNREKQ